MTKLALVVAFLFSLGCSPANDLDGRYAASWTCSAPTCADLAPMPDELELAGVESATPQTPGHATFYAAGEVVAEAQLVRTASDTWTVGPVCLMNCDGAGVILDQVELQPASGGWDGQGRVVDLWTGAEASYSLVAR